MIKATLRSVDKRNARILRSLPFEIHRKGLAAMLTILGSGLFVAIAVVSVRKLSASFRSLLDVSADLDPLRPSAASDLKSSRPATNVLASEAAPCSESILQLFNSVQGTGVQRDAE